jgi:hypothetical protein
MPELAGEHAASMEKHSAIELGDRPALTKIVSIAHGSGSTGVSRRKGDAVVIKSGS